LAFAERGGEVGDRGKEAVGVVVKVFAACYRYKDGGGDRTTFRREMQSLWERGTTLPSWMVRAFCNDGTKLDPALWTFATVEGIEPTNHTAERALRPALFWRKGCFGADSAACNGFVAKILTVVKTCR
jgi:transposase